MLARYVQCHIRRGMSEVLAPIVFAHEVEILKEVHGDGSVTIIDDLPDHPPVELDKDEEFSRLMNVYGDHATGQPLAERVYGRGAEKLSDTLRVPSQFDNTPRRGRPRREDTDEQ